MDKLAEEVFEHVDGIFGLTTVLELPRELAFKISKEVVELVASAYSSKPSPETLIKRIKRDRKTLFEVVVSKVLELVEKPTPRQLEYIVANGGRALLGEVEKLYKLAVAYKMDSAIEVLKHVWNTYRGKGFVECPRCGFNAVSPERYCIICGYVVSEDYLRAALGFEEKFNAYLKTASIAELNDVLKLGYVLVGEKGVYSPNSQRARLENPILYIVYLRKSEISRLLEEASSRELPI